jgi:hypothetical protein
MKLRRGGVVIDLGPREDWMLRDPMGGATTEARRARARSSNLRCKYGISEEEFDLLVESQDRRCAICRRPETIMRRGKLSRLSVDHDHTTGLVRGLLCQTCNSTLGLLRDDPDWIAEFSLRARTYLAEHDNRQGAQQVLLARRQAG